MHVDWARMWIPEVALLDIVIRGSIIYLTLYAYLRFFRRDAGSLATPDVLFIVLIADAVQNGMANEYHSITEALVLVATLAAWDLAIDTLSFYFPVMEKILQGPPVLLIRQGKVLIKNLQREMITRSELEAELRLRGIEHFSQVKRCFLEGDGQVSVIRMDGKTVQRQGEK